jgi:hypothetical protein
MARGKIHMLVFGQRPLVNGKLTNIIVLGSAAQVTTIRGVAFTKLLLCGSQCIFFTAGVLRITRNYASTILYTRIIS